MKSFLIAFVTTLAVGIIVIAALKMLDIPSGIKDVILLILGGVVGEIVYEKIIRK